MTAIIMRQQISITIKDMEGFYRNSEGLFGEVKSFHGLARAKFSGIDKVKMQFLLIASALNLKKMVKVLGINEEKSCFKPIILNIIKFRDNIVRKLQFKLVFLES
jgi:hypothetical protein